MRQTFLGMLFWKSRVSQKEFLDNLSEVFRSLCELNRNGTGSIHNAESLQIIIR